jgi:geranylgeranyl diphosphate synthase type I
VSVQDYLRMIERKTSALLAAAAAAGAHVAGASTEKVEGLRGFGQHLGVGYQIRDDVLGIWGDPGELGKPVGSDLRRNKRSLPIIHALAAAAEAGRTDLASRLARGATTDEEAAGVAAQMESIGSREFSERMAHESLARAFEALAGLDLRQSPAADLRALASYLLERTE